MLRRPDDRGAFGIDGVLSADGFLPTELNTRKSAGATAVLEVGPTPSGIYARAGDRTAPLEVALLAYLDRAHATTFGAVEAAPQIRPR